MAQIVVGFPGAPKIALKKAQDALESEPSQLKSLIENASIINEFEAICDVADHLKTLHNKFGWAIANKLDKRSSGHGKFRKGADIVYAIRCSIAHAGSADIFYERYPDGEVVIKQVLPYLETAVLKFLGIIVSA